MLGWDTPVFRSHKAKLIGMSVVPMSGVKLLHWLPSFAATHDRSYSIAWRVESGEGDGGFGLCCQLMEGGCDVVFR